MAVTKEEMDVALASLSTTFSDLKVTDALVMLYVKIWNSEGNLPYESLKEATLACLNDPLRQKMPKPAELRQIAVNLKVLTIQAEEVDTRPLPALRPAEPTVKTAFEACYALWALNLKQGPCVHGKAAEELQDSIAKARLAAHEAVEAVQVVDERVCQGCYNSGLQTVYGGGREGVVPCQCPRGDRFRRMYQIATDPVEWNEYRNRQRRQQKARVQQETRF